jgi:iron(III) transport system substrate-binding protein
MTTTKKTKIGAKARLILSGCMLLTLCGAVLSSCGGSDTERVIIYTSTEDFRTEHMQQLLKEKFPKYDIVLEVLSTGNHAAKIKAEGTDTEADILLNLETGYLEGLQDVFADLSSYDTSSFLPEMVPASKKYLPWDKSSGAIVFNRGKLAEL